MSNKQVINILDEIIKHRKNDLDIDGGEDKEYCGRVSCALIALQEAKSRIQSLPGTDEWISINDRLPDEGKTFIYLTGNGKVMVCSNRTLDDWFIRKYAVTHWVYPIPSPITK